MEWKRYSKLNTIEYELKNGKGYIKEGSKWECTIKYNGQYLNGLRNGKGKEYDSINGQLKFEGEYKNGNRNEKGKEYYLNDKYFLLNIFMNMD